MATTIERAVHPLLLTASVLGLGVYSSEKLYLNIFYNLTIWIFYSCLTYYIVIVFKVEARFTSIYAIVDMQIGILANVTSLIMSLYKKKRFWTFMKRLAAVDDTLEQLGTPKIYQKLHMCTKKLLIGWLVCVHVLNIIDMLWWFDQTEDPRYMVIPYIGNYYYHCNSFMDLLFMTFLWYIGTGFDKMNEHVKCLLIREEHELRYIRRKAVLITRRFITRDNYKRLLWTSMHLHLELCQIARQLNTVFGAQITIQIAGYLLTILRICHYVFIHIKTKGRFLVSRYNLFGLYVWIFSFLIRFFCLNYTCERVTTKANEMERIIHKLTNRFQYADIRNEVYQFTLQIIHHPLKFTGMGFFYLGNSFLRNFFVTITTFVIIIMQTATIPKVYTGY